VIHNREAGRFEAHLGDQIAELVYELREGVYVFTHTGVPRAFEGRGVGSALVRAPGWRRCAQMARR
jgi:predicted GNAT family acetyltransferase